MLVFDFMLEKMLYNMFSLKNSIIYKVNNMIINMRTKLLSNNGYNGSQKFLKYIN